MKMKSLAIIATALAIISCAGHQDSAQTPADALMDRLVGLVEEGKIMYGHQDDLMYGHSWKLEDDASEFVQSDVYAVCGKYPADCLL